MPLTKGTRVRQVAPVIAGEVTDRRFNDSENQMEYLVLYPGADGEPAERWFLESQLTTEVQP